MFDLTDKVVVITGGAGKLGQKHAEALAEFKATPIIVDISKERAEAAAARIEEEYEIKTLGLEVDITRESQVVQCCENLLDEFGKIDVLINNATNNPKVESRDEKTNIFTRLENFDLEEWERDISVGLTGAFLCSKHIGYAISKNQNGGSILNISSDLGVIAPDQQVYWQSGLSDEQQAVKPVSYSVVKTGLIGLTRYLSTYWALKNVRCNALCFGGVFNDQLTDDFLQKMYQRIPQGRMAGVDEYKSAIVFAVSDASSFLNGAIISIDGGRSAW
jgi:NAD(P)-dependent dehydrogenase (short-subunit alcohol dehydrogenase family)